MNFTHHSFSLTSEYIAGISGFKYKLKVHQVCHAPAVRYVKLMSNCIVIVTEEKTNKRRFLCQLTEKYTK
jgi:hypothetical protein